MRPYRFEAPFTLKVQLREPAQAGAVSNIPGVQREGASTVVFTTDDYRELYGAVEAIGAVAHGVS